MTVPIDYRQASAEFDTLLQDVARATGLQTRHQAFTTLQGVMFAFRSRLDPLQALRFVQILPPLLRGLFVADWKFDADPVPVGSPADWLADQLAAAR